jgi:putative DNA methylase
MAGERVTRRNLPHWYVPGAAHFVTFRVAGTLPREVIDCLQRRKADLLRAKPDPGMTQGQFRERVHKQLFAAFDDYLDADRSESVLCDARIAALVRGSLYHLHGAKYGLLAYSIMPNHVHVLFVPFEVPVPAGAVELACELGECPDGDSPLSGIMHSLKGYTAHEANRLLRRSGAFWQHESYDHWVRDEDEMERVVKYINANAVRAKLASRAHDWFWCSAHDRYLMDGDVSGWLVAEKGLQERAGAGTSEDACATEP